MQYLYVPDTRYQIPVLIYQYFPIHWKTEQLPPPPPTEVRRITQLMMHCTSTNHWINGDETSTFTSSTITTALTTLHPNKNRSSSSVVVWTSTEPSIPRWWSLLRHNLTTLRSKDSKVIERTKNKATQLFRTLPNYISVYAGYSTHRITCEHWQGTTRLHHSLHERSFCVQHRSSCINTREQGVGFVAVTNVKITKKECK